MKISEMIHILQTELDKRGDVEVRLYGDYGAEAETFEIATDNHIPQDQRHMLWIYTGINTG